MIELIIPLCSITLIEILAERICFSMANFYDAKPPSNLAPRSEVAKTVSDREKRKEELSTLMPWLEEYELDSILYDEGYSTVVETPEKPADDFANWDLTNYSPIYRDTEGKYGAYNEIMDSDDASSENQDYSSIPEDEETAAIRERSRSILSKNIKTEATIAGFTLLIFVVVEILIGLGLAAYQTMVLGYRIADINSFLQNPDYMLLIQGVMLVLGLGIPFLLYIYFHQLPMSDIIPVHKLRQGEFFNMVFFGLGIYMCVQYIMNVISQGSFLVGGIYDYQLISVDTKGLGILYALICLVFIPAVIEEFVFRGVILQVFRRRGGDNFAIVLSSILCGLVYANTRGFGVFVISLAIGYITVFSGSILPAIAINIIRSLMSLIMVLLSSVVSPNIITYADAVLTIALMTLSLIIMPSLFDKFPDFFKLKRSNMTMTLGDKLKAALTRPSVIILFVYALTFSLLESIPIADIMEMFS